MNVFTCELLPTSVAVAGGRIAGVGDGYQGREERRMDGALLAPGFIEPHFHLESAMLRPPVLAELTVPRGTTTLVADPHEIAGVAGLRGVEFLLSDSEGLPLEIFFTAPSCVPSSSLETSGGSLGPWEVEHLLRHPRMLGLGEVMSYHRLARGDEQLLRKLESARGKVVDGHAPGLGGRELNAYLAAGIQSDHECTTAAEAREKLRLGMRIMIREGGLARDLARLLTAVDTASSRRFMLATDDRGARSLSQEGHLDLLLSRAVAGGMDPLTALQMVTINPAEHFRLTDRGALAPGYLADMVVLEELESFRVREVYKGGRKVAARGRLLERCPMSTVPPHLRGTVKLDPVTPGALELALPGGRARARIMVLEEHSIITGHAVDEVQVHQGAFVDSAGRPLHQLHVLERHHGSGGMGRALVRGSGLVRGALASSVAHDAHNIVCLSADPVSAAAAVNAVRSAGGGMAVTRGEELLHLLELPIAGLISDDGVDELLDSARRLEEAVGETGCQLEDPFMTLSFLSLAVVPHLKLTDRGLVDVDAQRQVELLLEE